MSLLFSFVSFNHECSFISHASLISLILCKKINLNRSSCIVFLQFLRVQESTALHLILSGILEHLVNTFIVKKILTCVIIFLRHDSNQYTPKPYCFTLINKIFCVRGATIQMIKYQNDFICLRSYIAKITIKILTCTMSQHELFILQKMLQYIFLMKCTFKIPSYIWYDCCQNSVLLKSLPKQLWLFLVTNLL